MARQKRKPSQAAQLSAASVSRAKKDIYKRESYMAEDIKGLIEKIQQEGIQAAEEKAKEIEAAAKKRAAGIVQDAEKEAAQLVDSAREAIDRLEKSSRATLEQAARDFLLSLREELDGMLGKIVLDQVRQALSPEALSEILAALIKDLGQAKEGQVIVALSEKELKKIEKGILSQLGEAAKKGITLKPSGEIGGGFMVSYDGGKSHFDFSDKALAEYLSARLKPRLAELLNSSVGGKKKQK